jgi:hypothetical protein
MKKLTASLISVILLLMLASCKTIGNFGNTADFNSDQFLERYDHNQAWTHLTARFCKAGNTIFFANSPNNNTDQNIKYADLESGFSGPLCGKPECRHSDETCNAYVFANNAEGLSYYDGRIYWVASDFQGTHIFSSALDGTDRKTVRDLDRSVFTKPTGNRYVMFHRGYMYLCGGTSTISDGVATYGSFIYSVPIEGNGDGIIIWDNSYSNPEVGVVCFMQPYRTGLYFMEKTWNIGKSDSDTLKLFYWDAAAQNLETLFEGEVPFAPNEFWVEENDILFSDVYGGNIYKYDFKSGKIEFLFDFNSDGSLYDLPNFSDDKIMSWVLDDDRAQVIKVTDFSGNTIFTGKLDIPEYREHGGSFVFCGADSDNLYFYLTIVPDESELNGSYGELVAVSLDTGEVRVLWSGKAET